ncbi:reticulocalbin-2 [Schistocerca americana]|uniref:reticulocalbin-2 n=1 Tax=Schistocerca americana TaxID=7009 RepID=UPI001F4FAEA2|nr:reticulocalbin-2 [Schistocerca americana]
MMKGEMSVFFYCNLLIFTLFTTCSPSPASPHIHAHNRGQEREEDGGYVPRDAQHYAGGEHHSEFDHVAILGSVKEAEAFDQLEPEEAKRRLQILLTKMDLNNDQMIDRNELHAWIIRSFKMLSEEDANDRFEDADENEDGKVTWAEYAADSFGLGANEDDDVSNDSNDSDAKIIKEDKMIFEAADKNKDGALDKSEFVRFSHPEDHPDMLPLILKQTLSEKDTDGDGFIDFKEFVGEKARHEDKEWLMVEKEKFDHDYDKDSDGKLNSAEILSWVVPSDEEIAEDEVSHLFAESDDNEDGILSFDEVINHHETFVGSEVTDYGDHLHNIHVFQDEL